jgi:hypothetical protein
VRVVFAGETVAARAGLTKDESWSSLLVKTFNYDKSRVTSSDTRC